MLKQTFLTFKGALGFITGSGKRGEEDSDSGISSSSKSSDDEKEDIKNHYTSTGILAPAGQSMNEISVERFT
jgi:hypothetical protein